MAEGINLNHAHIHSASKDQPLKALIRIEMAIKSINKIWSGIFSLLSISAQVDSKTDALTSIKYVSFSLMITAEALPVDNNATTLKFLVHIVENVMQYLLYVVIIGWSTPGIPMKPVARISMRLLLIDRNGNGEKYPDITQISRIKTEKR